MRGYRARWEEQRPTNTRPSNTPCASEWECQTDRDVLTYARVRVSSSISQRVGVHRWFHGRGWDNRWCGASSRCLRGARLRNKSRNGDVMCMIGMVDVNMKRHVDLQLRRQYLQVWQRENQRQHNEGLDDDNTLKTTSYLRPWHVTLGIWSKEKVWDREVGLLLLLSPVCQPSLGCDLKTRSHKLNFKLT